MDAALVARCFEEARALSSAHYPRTPPFDLQPLIQHFRIVAVNERPLDRDARLRLESGQFVIDVNSMYPLVRRRLSIAHEIGHLIVSQCTAGNAWVSGHQDPSVEALCNQLAAALLVPDWALEHYFESASTLGDWRKPIRCSTVIAAASCFKVSIDVMASRVFREIGLASEIAALVWREGENTDSRSSQRELRISTAWHSCEKSIYIPRNKTAPVDSVIRKAFEKDGTFRGVEALSIGRLKGSFAIEASGFGSNCGDINAKYARGVLSLVSLRNDDAAGSYEPALARY